MDQLYAQKDTVHFATVHMATVAIVRNAVDCAQD